MEGDVPVELDRDEVDATLLGDGAGTCNVGLLVHFGEFGDLGGVCSFHLRPVTAFNGLGWLRRGRLRRWDIGDDPGSSGDEFMPETSLSIKGGDGNTSASISTLDCCCD